MSVIEPQMQESINLLYYNEILENSTDIIYIIEVREDGRFIHLDINNAFAEAVNLPKESIIGRYVDELEDKEFRETLTKKYSSCVTAGTKTDFVSQYNLPIGQKIYHSTLSPIRNEEGRIHRIVGIARDITEQKHQENLLIESQTRLQTIIENEPECIKIIDAAGHLVYMNPAGLDMIEATLEQVEGKEVLGIIVEEYRDAFIQMHQRVIAGEKVHLIFETIGFKGKRCWLETTSVPMQKDGETVLLGVTRDITERKTQEAHLQKTKVKLASVISTIPDLVWVKDENGVYLLCNPAFERFFGASCDEIIGKTDYDFLAKEQADFFRQKDKEAMAAGVMCMNEEEIIFAKSGERALLETRKIPVYNNQEFMGVLGIGRDITKMREAEKMLYMLTHAINLSSESLFIMDIDTAQFLYVNDTAAKILEYSKEELTGGMSVIDIDWSITSQFWKQHIEEIKVMGSVNIESTHRSKSGRVYPIDVIAHYFEYDGKGYNLAVTRDITERKKIEETLKLNEKRLKEAQKIAKIGSWELEFPGLMLYWSDEIYRIFEIDPETFQPSYDNFLNAIHPEDRIKIDRVFHDSIQNKIPYDITHRLLMADGRIKYVQEIGETSFDELGNPIRSFGTVQDISERVAIEKKVEFLAHHDALTGLPNRLLVKERAEQIMASAKRAGTKAAFIFIDLDGFKAINDTLGHAAGDMMLKTIASRLRECVRESDTISRQGGDEFLLILSNVKDLQSVTFKAEKILKELEKSFEVATHTISVSGSIGIALYPDHGDTYETLLQCADTAMYKAKESGKNDYCFYTEQMKHNLIGEFKLQNDLKKALQNEEFVLFYQPQIDLLRNCITGAEALIRWRHPQLGMIPPMSFISIAESSGLIVSIGQWVIEEACRQASIWHKTGIEVTIAVNISAMQFKRGNLEEIVQNALSASKINPNLLELELTESIMMNDVENTLQCVRNLKTLGVQLSIDDFGTGYSSLAYLKRFAVDKLKIDQSFVRDILLDQEDAVIVQTIIQMAKNLNLKTIAEGVENSDVLTVIESFGCDEVQGYHFAKPMEAMDFETYYNTFDAFNC
ncbi:MAG: EAL domain-containing protein [Sulfuricurvum sp.]|jgi:diguanylate cyclase (GGDEF)-like protein/PAS domain S-box-containing protein